MKKKKNNYKGGFSGKGLCVGIVILAGVLCLLLPHYVGQFEKTRAMSMQAMLINVLIAEDSYYGKQGVFTDKWQDLIKKITQPVMLEPQLQAVPNQPEKYFIGFGKDAAEKQNGYIVSLSVGADKQSGRISAVRTKNWFYRYELSREFPNGDLQCKGKWTQRFYTKLIRAVDEFELKNLTPVVQSEAETK